MNRPDVIDLVTEVAGTSSAYGVHATTTEESRTVMCMVGSVTRSEYYNALNAGIQPEVVFSLALAKEYQGERYVDWQGKRYEVVRTYMTEDDGIEITVKRSDVN